MSNLRPKSGGTSDTNQNQFCRICFSSRTSLIQTPCSCTGTVGYVHLRCIQRWRFATARNLDVCEICHKRYKPLEGIIIPKRWFEKSPKKPKLRENLNSFCFCLLTSVILPFLSLSERSRNYSWHSFADLFTHSASSP